MILCFKCSIIRAQPIFKIRQLLMPDYIVFMLKDRKYKCSRRLLFLAKKLRPIVYKSSFIVIWICG